MNRRDAIKLLLMGASAMELDPELLLWTPNKARIVVPSKISLNEIVAAEMERIMPMIVNIFERDDMFYKALADGTKAKRLEARPINIPLRMGKSWGQK